MSGHPEGSVPAPELLEVAQTWWDVDRVPEVRWSKDAQLFELVDPGSPQRRLELLRLTGPADDARLVADVLANGLAACDFPPTGSRASPRRVQATLRAARVDVPQLRKDQAEGR